MKHVFRTEQGTLRNGWKALLFLAANIIASGTAIVLAFSTLRLFNIQSQVAVLEPLIAGVVCLALTALALRLEKRPFTSVGLRMNRRWWREALAGTLAGALLMVFTAALIRGAGGFHWERALQVGPSQLLAGFALFTVVAVNEECLFRGYLFQRLVDGMGVWPTQLALAILFGVFHWANPGMVGGTKIWATLNIALVAVLFGAVYLKTRSLAMPIGLHLGWNWTQGNLLGFPVSGTTLAKGWWTPVLSDKPQWLTGGAFGLEATLACTVLCVVAIGALAVWKGSESAS